MKHFIVSKNGNFVEVERIVSANAKYDDYEDRDGCYVHGCNVHYIQGGGSENYVWFEESISEVRALIQKALGNEVSFTSSK